MKKNGQYVGVDEKYVPEEEKYVENNLNDEIKQDMSNIYKGAKEYVTDKDNQEKIKKVGKTGLKITAGVVIVRVIFSVLLSLIAIALIGFCFYKVFVGVKDFESEFRETKVEDVEYEEDVSEQADDFNLDIELYSGTQYGSPVSRLLNNVITKIKKNTNHPITVIYGTTTTSNPDEIVALKKQFDKRKQYEVQMDYDSKGYINKITITDY